MYRLLLVLLLLAAFASLGANLMEFGGASLHPRHGDRLAAAASRDGLLVQAYTAAGRALLPVARLDESARRTADSIYGAAFDALDLHASAIDERTLTDMLNAPGVYRPAWRVANSWATPVLFGALLLAWVLRPRRIQTFSRRG